MQCSIIDNSAVDNRLQAPPDAPTNRDGKSVKNSTDANFRPKSSTKERTLRHIAIRTKTAY